MAFRLVNRDKLMAPRKCVICETHPSHRVVDTGYNNMRNSVVEALRGRKYVCEGCGEKIGKALGMLVSKQAQDFKERIITLENQLAEAKERENLSENIEAALALMTKGRDEAPVAEVENSDPA